MLQSRCNWHLGLLFFSLFNPKRAHCFYCSSVGLCACQFLHMESGSFTFQKERRGWKGIRYSLQADCLQNTALCIVHRTKFTCYTLPPVRVAHGHFLYLILCSYYPLRLLSGLQPASQQRLEEQNVQGKSLGISPPDSAGHQPEWFQEGTVMTVP